jgi:hypothetical protein
MLTGEQHRRHSSTASDIGLRPYFARTTMSACGPAGGGLGPQEEVRKKEKGSRKAPL